MSIKADLEPIFSKAKSAPILFAGAGFSRRYLDAPDWASLLTYFARYTNKSFDYYRSLANGDMAMVGSLIAIDFHKIWFEHDEFSASREAYGSNCKSQSDPLKYEVSQYLKKFEKIHDDLEELSSLSRISLEAIITTNYDMLLECIFEEYKVFPDQESLILGTSYGAGEIYKIHGSIETPNTIVLTSEDYENFKERNVILAAKLLTLIVEHPVVFLGYRISDPNIRTILSSIVKCLSPDGLDAIQNSLVIVEWDPNEEEGVTKRSFRINDVDLPYTHVSCHGFQEVYESMATFERRFPVRLLRALKKSIFQLVEESDPNGRLVVVNIDKAEELANADFVIGIGVQDKLGKIGYKGLGRDDVFRYVLKGGEYEPEQILQNVIPELSKGNANCPVFRFLSESGRIRNREINTSELHDSVAALALSTPEKYFPTGYLRNKAQLNDDFGSIEDLVQHHGSEGALYRIALLNQEKIDLATLREFLISVEDQVRENSGTHISSWRKLVCFYDCLAYRHKVNDTANEV